MKKVLVVMSVIVVVSLLAGGVWYTHGFGFLSKKAQDRSVDTTVQNVPVPPLTETYRNDTFHFSFKYPAGYTVRETPSELATTILIERADHTGIQIYITPYKDTDTTITAERVQSDVPDMEVSDPQPIILGSQGEGLAFKSDNDDFGGDSREVWFVVAGRLYQISTYAAYDKVLQAIMGTWTFF